MLHQDVRLGVGIDSIEFDKLLNWILNRLRTQLQIFETYRVLALDSVQVDVIAQCSRTLGV